MKKISWKNKPVKFYNMKFQNGIQTLTEKQLTLFGGTEITTTKKRFEVETKKGLFGSKEIIKPVVIN